MVICHNRSDNQMVFSQTFTIQLYNCLTIQFGWLWKTLRLMLLYYYSFIGFCYWVLATVWREVRSWVSRRFFFISSSSRFSKIIGNRRRGKWMMLQDLEGTEVKCYCFKTETAPQNNEDRIVSFVLPFMFCLHIQTEERQVGLRTSIWTSISLLFLNRNC